MNNFHIKISLIIGYGISILISTDYLSLFNILILVPVILLSTYWYRNKIEELLTMYSLHILITIYGIINLGVIPLL